MGVTFTYRFLPTAPGTSGQTGLTGNMDDTVGMEAQLDVETGGVETDGRTPQEELEFLYRQGGSLSGKGLWLPLQPSTTFFNAFPILPPLGILVDNGASGSPEEAVVILAIGALGTIGIGWAVHRMAIALGGWGNYILGPLPLRAEEFRGTAAKATAGGEERPLWQDDTGYNPEKLGRSLFEFNDRMPLRAVRKMKAGLQHLEQGQLLRANGGEDWQKSAKEISSAIADLSAALRHFRKAVNRIQVICCEKLAQAYQAAGDYGKAEEYFRSAAETIETMVKNGEEHVSKGKASSDKLRPFLLYLSERSAQNWISAAYAAIAGHYYNSALRLYSNAETQLEKAEKYAVEIGETELAGRLHLQREVLKEEGTRLVEDTLRRAMESEEDAREFKTAKKGDEPPSEKLQPSWAELIDLPWISPDAVAGRFKLRFEEIRQYRQFWQERLCQLRAALEPLEQKQAISKNEVVRAIADMLRSVGFRDFRMDEGALLLRIAEIKDDARNIAQRLETDDSAEKESKYIVDVILTAEEKHMSKGEAFENARDGAVLLIISNPDFAGELLDAFMDQNTQNPYLAWAIIGEIGAKHPELFTSKLVDRFRDWESIDRTASKAWQKANAAHPERIWSLDN